MVLPLQGRVTRGLVACSAFTTAPTGSVRRVSKTHKKVQLSKVKTEV